MVLHADKGGQLPGADSISASPGFTWGKSGNVGPSSVYLLNDTVPSNKAGRLVPLEDGLITEVFVAVELNATVTFAIEKRVGASFVELLTISLNGSERTKVNTYEVSVVKADELVCRLKSGSAKNPVIGIIIKGDSA